jgi:hypothetical protein
MSITSQSRRRLLLGAVMALAAVVAAPAPSLFGAGDAFAKGRDDKTRPDDKGGKHGKHHSATSNDDDGDASSDDGPDHDLDDDHGVDKNDDHHGGVGDDDGAKGHGKHRNRDRDRDRDDHGGHGHRHGERDRSRG